MEDITTRKASAPPESSLRRLPSAPEFENPNISAYLSGPQLPPPDWIKICNETELQNMLVEEKARSESHKSNYQALKIEHKRLQEENSRLQVELKSQLEKDSTQKTALENQLEMLRRQIVERDAEITHFRSQIITPDKLEVMRVKVREELEEPYRVRYAQLEADAEKYRAEYNKLRYESSFLKSEYEHEQAEHGRILEEVKMKYDADLKSLRKEREALLARLNTETSNDVQRVHALQRENVQLQLKVKGVLTELEEIRTQRESAGLQADNVARLQAKQTSEYVGTIKSLQGEKESLQMQVDRLQGDMSSITELNASLQTKFHHAEKEAIELKHKLEHCEHQRKLEVTNVRLEMTQLKGEAERERDTAVNNSEVLKSDLEMLNQCVEDLKKELINKEKEIQRKVQSAREEEWVKINQLETEKLDLDNNLRESERSRLETVQEKISAVDQAAENVRQTIAEKQQAAKECSLLREKNQTLQAKLAKYEEEQNCHELSHQKVATLEAKITAMQDVEDDLNTANSKLNSSVSQLEEELKLAHDELEKTRKVAEQILSQHRRNWEEEKNQMGRRIEELEVHIANAHSKAKQASDTYKTKKKKYMKLVEHLRGKIQLLQSRADELELQVNSLRQAVPQEEHLRLKKQFRDLQRRHQEFRSILLSSVPLNDTSVTFQPTPIEAKTPWFSYAEQEQQHLQELEVLQRRLDVVEQRQEKQAQELLATPVLLPMTSISRVTVDTHIPSDEGNRSEKEDLEIAGDGGSS